MDFETFFECATSFAPYPWQQEVAEQGLPELLSVPTGMGKTEGAVLAWAWRYSQGLGEPRHLVYCLPMRSLVRQTKERLMECLGKLEAAGIPKFSIHVLMGGELDEEWLEQPEIPWVLIGTQDMLLSRALNRGYAVSRFQWPVHFGLLNNDCRWIVDETQLMGPGLWTTAQLDWMRQKRFKSLIPCPTTWMSATIGAEFLDTTDRRKDGISKVAPFEISWETPQSCTEKLRERLERLRDARRPISLVKPPSGAKAPPLAEWLAREVIGQHRPGTLSLVICNTVAVAQEIFAALLKTETGPILLTSRFRPMDRQAAENRLTDFEQRRKQAPGAVIPDDPGLICVCTQVVEAGIDISAHRLWSEVAPWPSIVQRLGRMNRDGLDLEAQAYFWETPKPKRGAAATGIASNRIGPYLAEEIASAFSLLKAFESLSHDRPAREAFAALAQGTQAKPLKDSLKPKLTPLPRAGDLYDLFSTEQDLFGGFTDVSAFVRSSDPDADVTLFWRDWEKNTSPHGEVLTGPPFNPNEACAVPFPTVRDFLKDLRAKAWFWEDEAGHWSSIPINEIRPGMCLMLQANTGGYDSKLGWTGKPSHRLEQLEPPGIGRALNDDPQTESGYWAELKDHLADAEREARTLCSELKLPQPLAHAVIQASGWHDLGKAHPEWLEPLPGKEKADNRLFAKCPPVLALEVEPQNVSIVIEKVGAIILNADRISDRPGRLRWALREKPNLQTRITLRALPGVRRVFIEPFKPKLRHEAATALALWQEYRTATAKLFPALTVYLAATHHGKVRTVFRSIRKEGDDAFGITQAVKTLEVGGKAWPLDFSVAADGAEGKWSDDGSYFEMTGPGWTEIVSELLGPCQPNEFNASDGDSAIPSSEPRNLGPFALAYLEALVRMADWRASAKPSRCKKPGEVQNDG